MFRDLAHAPARRQNVLLMMLLATAAGMVNASGLFALGVHTSHMSGNLANVGEALASGDAELLGLAVRLVGAFFFGAMSAAVLLDAARHRERGRHATPLLLEAALLAAVSAFTWRFPGVKLHAAIWALGFAMGMQNALITRVSGAVIRTTHMTGQVTDLALALVRMATWVREHRHALGVWGALTALPRAVEFERAWLHLGLLAAFVSGATLGPTLWLWHGGLAFAVPAGLVLGLVYLDFRPRPSGVPAEPAHLPPGAPEHAHAAR